MKKKRSRHDDHAEQTEVRQVRCPACGAPPGERCRGARGRPREANHAERVALIPRRNPNTQPAGAWREAVARITFADDLFARAESVDSTAEVVHESPKLLKPPEPPAEGSEWGAHDGCTGTLFVEEADSPHVFTQCDHCKMRMAFRLSPIPEDTENPPEGGRGATTR